MTSKQILDSFSETLMRDERIFSAQERALVANLLQHAKAATSASAETQEAVRKVIASAVGETIAQRAFAVLGGNIVERILESSSLTETAANTMKKGGPETPGVARPLTTPGPETPGIPRPAIPPGPETPGIPRPQPPRPPSPGPETPSSGQTTTVVSRSATALAAKPVTLAANCVVLDEFLAPQELAELTRFTLEHEADFKASEVISPTNERGVVNYEHRRSKCLVDLAHHQGLILDRIKSVLPQVLDKLGMDEFPIHEVEAQITASNDGDFFHFHSDNGNEPVASRHLTFVYFFHREPQQFEGGELRIHDARLEEGDYVSEGTYQAIVPRQNQIVFFPCELMHEITPVGCRSQLFADSRFTLNGWLRQ